MQEIDDEICRVKLELKKSMDAYHSVCNEAKSARLMVCFYFIFIRKAFSVEKEHKKIESKSC